MDYFLAALLALALFVVITYNLLVRRRNAVDNAFAGIDAYLQMRYDLIPNLVEVVKGYAAHERETLAEIIALRQRASANALAPDARVQLANRIGESMRGLLAIAEAYPDLQAGENFQQLQRALNEVEERVSASRRAFNAAVLDYNNTIDAFPTNLVASAAKFKRRTFFETDAAERLNVNVRESLASTR